MTLQKLPRWVLILILAVSGFSLLNFLYNAVFTPMVAVGVDFAANYCSAELVRQGINPFDQTAFYACASSHGWSAQEVTPFVYHPLFAWVWMPLAGLAPAWANAVWVMISHVAFWTSLVLVGKAFTRSEARTFSTPELVTWGAAVALLAFNFRPLFVSLQSGRVDAGLFFLLCLGYYLLMRKRDFWAGIPIGLAIVIKLTPALILLYLAITRRWRAILSAILICVVLFGAGVLLLGWETNYTFWAGVLPSLVLGPDSVVDAGLYSFLSQTPPGAKSLVAFIAELPSFPFNQALSGLFHRLFAGGYGEDLAVGSMVARLFSLVSAVAIVGAVMWVVTRRSRADSEPAGKSRAFTLGYALVVTITPLISSAAWESHFLMLSFGFFAVVFYALHTEGAGDSITWAGASLAYAGIAIWYPPDIYDAWGEGIWVFALFGRTYAALLLGAVLAQMILRAKKARLLERWGPVLRGRDGARRWEWVTVLLSIPLILMALSLRLSYAERSSLHVQEHATLLRLRQVHADPRSLLEPRAGGSESLTETEDPLPGQGFSDKVPWRLPSVALGTTVVVLLFVIGWAVLSPRAALLATAWLVFDSASILWSGRAQANTLVQFLLLLATYTCYEGVVKAQRDNIRHLSVLLLLSAIFIHPNVAALLPAFALAWLIWLKPQDWRRPAVWVDLALLIAGLAARWLLLPPPALSPLLEAGMAPAATGLSSRMGMAVQAAGSFFTESGRWSATLLAVGGLLGIGYRLVQARRGRDHPPLDRAWLYLMVLTLVGAGGALLMGGGRDPSDTLFAMLPWLLLLAAAVADKILQRMWAWAAQGLSSLMSTGGEFACRGLNTQRLGPVLLMSLLVIAVSSFASSRAVATSKQVGIGYDEAFRFVAERWQTGDAIATVAPAASYLFLERCDYVVAGSCNVGSKDAGFDLPFVEATNVQILETSSDLKSVVAAHPRLWLVIDSTSLYQECNRLLAEDIWQTMELSYYDSEAFVFLSRPEMEAPEVHQPNRATFDGQVSLLSTDLATTQNEPGSTLHLTLHWQALSPLNRDYTVFVHVDDATGRTLATGDGPATGGLYPMTQWQPGTTVLDRRVVDLPAGMPAGRYRLRVGLIRPGTQERLPLRQADDTGTDQATAAFFWVGALPEVHPPQNTLAADFGGQICLQGYDLEGLSSSESVHPGEELRLTFHWGACGRVLRNYHTFVHLIGPDDRVVAQGDAPPLGGEYPTWFWHDGEILLDTYTLRVPAGAASGSYRIHAGLYLLQTDERLPVDGTDNALFVTSFQVIP